jgi:hypothetical protein
MDNTALFFQLVQSYEQQAHGLAKSHPAGQQGVSASLMHASSFTRAAAEVGRELHSTASKVQQLTKSALEIPPVFLLSPAPSQHPSPLYSDPPLPCPPPSTPPPQQWCVAEACLTLRVAAAARRTG